MMPLLFMLTVKYKVFTDFPACLFRWVLVVDWGYAMALGTYTTYKHDMHTYYTI